MRPDLLPDLPQLSVTGVCSMRSRSRWKACAVNGSPLKTICFTCLRPCFWRYSVTFIQRMVSSEVRITIDVQICFWNLRDLLEFQAAFFTIKAKEPEHRIGMRRKIRQGL